MTKYTTAVLIKIELKENAESNPNIVPNVVVDILMKGSVFSVK